MSEQTTTDVTEALPTLEPETRSKMKKGATITFLVIGGILIVDDAVKRFKNRKQVTLTVVDTPEA